MEGAIANQFLKQVKVNTDTLDALLTTIDADTSAMEAREVIQTDFMTGFHTTIDGDHRYIHDGMKFSVPIERIMAKAEKYLISFTAPAGSTGKLAHWRPAVISSTASNLIVRLYENIVSAGGSSVTPINMNLNSANVSVSTVKKGVTATVNASNIIALFSVGLGGGPQSRAGGSGGATEEIVLDAGTEYIIEIEEPNVASTTAIVELRWYEEG